MKQEEYIQGKWYWVEFPNEGSYIARITGTTVAFSEFALQVSEFYSENGTGGLREESFLEKYCKGLATPAQIETCLKAYAEKNGYVDGALVSNERVKEDKDPCLVGNNFWYSKDADALYCHRNAILYRNGQWAEIVQHAPIVQDAQDVALTDSIHKHILGPNYGTLDKTKLEVRGEMVSIQELIEVYQKYLEIKTIIG